MLLFSFGWIPECSRPNLPHVEVKHIIHITMCINLLQPDVLDFSPIICSQYDLSLYWVQIWHWGSSYLKDICWQKSMWLYMCAHKTNKLTDEKVLTGPLLLCFGHHYTLHPSFHRVLSLYQVGLTGNELSYSGLAVLLHLSTWHTMEISPDNIPTLYFQKQRINYSLFLHPSSFKSNPRWARKYWSIY